MNHSPAPTVATRAPKYRADIKGQVAIYIAEFEASVRAEINNPESDTFLFCVEDAHAYAEYSDYLTEHEMQAAFKRAERV